MVSFATFSTLLAALSLSPADDKPVPAESLHPVASNFKQSNASSPSCYVQPYNPGPIPAPTFSPFDRRRASVFRYRQQQSVNLGSWFVQENWMAPSLMTCANGHQAGEHDVASGWGNTTSARQLLEHHWDTWVTENDFAYLHSIGINTVRIPIGYWSLGPSFCAGTAFADVSDVYQNSWARVLRAVSTAEKYGIGVLIDLHGAPGSQNVSFWNQRRGCQPLWKLDQSRQDRRCPQVHHPAARIRQQCRWDPAFERTCQC